MITRRSLLGLFSFAPVTYVYNMLNPKEFNLFPNEPKAPGPEEYHIKSVQLISEYDFSKTFDHSNAPPPGFVPHHLMSLIIVSSDGMETEMRMDVKHLSWTIRNSSSVQ